MPKIALLRWDADQISDVLILRLANTPAQLVEIGLNYYRITALNLFFTFFNNVYIAIEKARGNGSKIMRINFAMALTKFSFSAFFAFPQMLLQDYQTTGLLLFHPLYP